jgi:lipoate-protein ligase B
MGGCTAVWLGTVPYLEAWEMQRRLHKQVVEGHLPDLLLLLEHPHVYTLGRRGTDSDILVSDEKLAELGTEVHFIDRGGEATYHGPGQLVGYPIVNLRQSGHGPLSYVRGLVDAITLALAEFGIRGESAGRPTGVWVDEAKIAAIGVKISRGVTMHGFALNVDPDLSYFDHIVPCGMPEAAATSMSSELSKHVDMDHAVRIVASHLAETFGWSLQWSTLGALDEVIEVSSSGATR